MNAKIISLLLGLSLVLYSCSTQPKVDSAIIAGKVDISWANTLKLARGPVTLIDSWTDQLGDKEKAAHHFRTIVELNNFSPNWYTAEASIWLKENN